MKLLSDWADKILKNGGCLRRLGWNGKGMFIFLIPGSTFNVSPGKPMEKHFAIGTEVNYHAHIDMKTADNKVVPWLASQTDILADDWEECEPARKDSWHKVMTVGL